MAPTLSLGQAEVDLAARGVRADGREVDLTMLEARLLAYLAARPDTDVPRSELLSNVWGYSPTASTRAVDFVVSRLRTKLGRAGRTHLLTSHGVGYRLVLDPKGRTGPPQVPIRLPTGVVDVDRGCFVPDLGDPVVLTRAEIDVLLRVVVGRARPRARKR